MKSLFSFVAFLLCVTCAQAQDRETETKIGSWKNMKFSVLEKSTGKTASIFVSDEYVVNTVYIARISAEDLRKLRDKLDETIAELEKK